MRKRPLGRLKPRWKDRLEKDVKKIEPEIRRREAAEDRDRWQSSCLAAWS